MNKNKMPSSFTILYIILIFIAMLTFFVPSGEYIYTCKNGEEAIKYTPPNQDEEYVCPINEKAATELNAAQITGDEVNKNLYTKDSTYKYKKTEQKPQGLWQVLNAPVNGFYEAVDIALFVIIIGGFINVVIQTGALDLGINSLLIKYKNKEQYLIPILMVLFAIGGTTFGMAEETIAFYLLIVPIFYKAGYDAMVGFMVIMLGAGIGVLASTVNPFAIGVASASAGLSMGDGIISRVILWIILVMVTIIYVMKYAKKVKTNPEKSLLYDLKNKHDKAFLTTTIKDEKITKHHKVVLTLFGLTFLIMILGVIPWPEFGINLFSNFNDWLNQFKILAGTGQIVELGSWWFGELSSLFLTFAIIIGIYAKKTKILKGDLIEFFIIGCKDLLSVALIIGLARGIQVIMNGSGLDSTLLYYGSNILQGLSSGLFIIFTFLFYIPMSFLIPSTSGLAAATIPVMAPLGQMVYGSVDGAVQVITAYSAATGIVNLITPTSGVVIGGLALAKIPYDRWVKQISPFLIAISIFIMVYLFVLSTII